MKIRYALWVAALLIFPNVHAPAATLYVDLNSTNPVPPYADWSTAATNIQDAVDASTNGDLILVTNGIYLIGGRLVPGDSTPNRLAVTNSVTVQSVNGAAVTVIQGYQNPGTTNGPGAVRCVYLAGNASLIGFTLSGGATRTGAGSNSGGGARCGSAMTVLSNCVFTANAAVLGAGVSSGTCYDCVFSNNIAQNYGGGGVNGAFISCLFEGNSAVSGGAVASLGRASLFNCTVFGNSAFSGGGLVALGGGAPAYLWVSNCIVYGNLATTSSNYAEQVGAVSMNYCCTLPLPPTGVGNFTNDPAFVNAAAGDFHLRSNSPCINAGSTNVVGAVDLDGNPRLLGDFVDIGAYEYQLPAPVPVIPSIQATYTGVSTGIVVDFTGQIAGHFTASRWDFGDGAVISNQLPNVSHGWTAPGDYEAALWGYNDSYPNGLSATVVIHVLINPVHYVSQNGTNPIAPYLSWATAATNIQDAVDAAYVGGTVVVSNGVYNSGGEAGNRVSVAKQLTVESLNGPAVTTIDGGAAMRCVYLTNDTTLAGFTLTNGNAGTGGGMYCESADAIISNCILVGNSASYLGGGAYSGTLINCLVISNSAYVGGGVGIWSQTPENITKLNNCIVYGNTASFEGGGLFSEGNVTPSCLWANNCIVVGNIAPTGSNYNYYTAATMNYCCTVPLPPPSIGFNNFTNDPLFVNPATADFHLQPNSPCINSGNNAYVTSATDLDGNPRVVGGTVDIGAYEYQMPVSRISYAWLQQYGMPINTNTDTADPDADGMNNYQEWIAGTNPTNALSVLEMLNPLPTNNPAGLVVSWESVSNRTYFLQSSTNLGTQPAFSTVQSNIVGQAGTTSYTDTNAVGNGPFFYHVGVQQ